ncbi:hypothetical protein V8E54_012561 [Elaphomyces granulatus]
MTFFRLIKMIIFGKRYAEINSFPKPTGPPEPIESPKFTDPKPTDPKSTPSDVFRIACDLIDYIPPSSTPPTVNNTVDNAQYSPEKQEELELDSLQIRDTEANEQKAAKEDTVETDAAKKDTIEKGMIEKDAITMQGILNFTDKQYYKVGDGSYNHKSNCDSRLEFVEIRDTVAQSRFDLVKVPVEVERSTSSGGQFGGVA